MKETPTQHSTGISAQEPGGALYPQGIGMAVAFDWGLAVQILATPFLITFFGFSSPVEGIDMSSTLARALSFIVVLPFAALLVLYGEAVRRGRDWARKIQIVANATLTLVGIATILSLYRGIKSGNFWPIVTEVILLIFSPLIAWRLSRPVTARWFKTVTSTDAGKRHGGIWIFYIALWALAGGVLQAIAGLK